MARKRTYTPEEMVAKLRQAEVLLAQGKTVAEAVRSIGVTEPTYYRWRTQPFPRARLMQALGVDGVDRVSAFYVGNAAWKNPTNNLKRTLLVFGTDPVSGLLDYDGMDEASVETLQQRDTILFDERSKPVFGPIPALLAEGRLFGELANHRVEVVGLFQLGPTVGSEGHSIVSDTTFMQLFPGRTRDQVDVGAIFLRPGADPLAVKAAMAPILADDVMLMTHAELVAFEKRYWSETAPIGFIFGMGVAIGLVVGCVIVYQILFSDIARHISAYATLKAMGYSNFYLARVVMGPR